MTGIYRLIYIKGPLIKLLATLGNVKVFEGDKGHNILTHVKGPLIKLLAALGDKKVFEGDSGHNVCLGKRWGEFTIWRSCDEYSKGNEIKLTYLDWPIEDLLIPDGRDFKGTFFWRGKEKGEFRLKRIGEVSPPSPYRT